MYIQVAFILGQVDQAKYYIIQSTTSLQSTILIHERSSRNKVNPNLLWNSEGQFDEDLKWAKFTMSTIYQQFIELARLSGTHDPPPSHSFNTCTNQWEINTKGNREKIYNKW